MIQIKNVSKNYRMGTNEVHALRDVSLTIEDGDFVAIMGPSGSGKSTLAHILGLLDVPSDGKYLLNNKDISNLKEDELAVLRRDEIGFIFQQFNLLPRMNAYENVLLPILYSKKDTGVSDAGMLLERVGLKTRSHHRPNELSGGQQQRVAIARSLINRPNMILADEPTGNLDSVSEVEIMKTLEELNEQGITVIIVTHEEEIGLKAKRLIKMRDGVVQSDERLKPLASDVKPRIKKYTKLRSVVHWSEIYGHFVQGLKTLAGNKVRSALSVLGILIGVAAVIAMLALGKGAQTAIEQQLSSLGSNLLVVRPGAWRVGAVVQPAGEFTRLTYEDALAIKRQIPTVHDVSASMNGRVRIAYKNKNWTSEIIGTVPSYERIREQTPTMGRFFTEDENTKRSRVAVVGMTIIRELFKGENPIGATIKINRVSFQVIGILPEKGTSGWRDQDDLIVIPLSTAKYRVLGKDFVDSLDIQVRDADQLEPSQAKIKELMQSRKRLSPVNKDEAFDIRNMAELQSVLAESNKTMTLLLASIAAISLLVGGIGIMNIMLVSVTERTKEIGLRKAIGARKIDILLQFLVESVVVSIVGGVAGIILGWATCLLVGAITGWTMAISLQSIVISFGFSALIGIIFGIYPAKTASDLNPIDALRYE